MFFLTETVIWAGMTFREGTSIVPRTEPASGGYQTVEMIGQDGRLWFVSLRPDQFTEVTSSPDETKYYAGAREAYRKLEGGIITQTAYQRELDRLTRVYRGLSPVSSQVNLWDARR